MDLPTISDEKMEDTPMEWESVAQEQARILNSVNDMDEMEKLGKMAFENFEELEKLFAMPDFLKGGLRQEENKFDHYIHL